MRPARIHFYDKPASNRYSSIFMTSQHKTRTHPFYIGMYIHMYTHIYIYMCIYILLRRNVYIFLKWMVLLWFTVSTCQFGFWLFCFGYYLIALSATARWQIQRRSLDLPLSIGPEGEEVDTWETCHDFLQNRPMIFKPRLLMCWNLFQPKTSSSDLC